MPSHCPLLSPRARRRVSRDGRTDIASGGAAEEGLERRRTPSDATSSAACARDFVQLNSVGKETMERSVSVLPRAGAQPQKGTFPDPEEVVFLWKPRCQLTSTVTASAHCCVPRRWGQACVKQRHMWFMWSLPAALLQHCPAAQYAELRSEQSTALLGVQKWQSSVWDNKCCSSIHVPVLFSVCNSSNQGLMYSRALSFSVHVLGNHRIIKVEKTLKISQSNRPPTTNDAH